MHSATHDFGGRLVVVTGGTGALGSAVVDRLLDCGARVRVPVFESDELERFVHADHPRVEVQTGVDLSDAASCEAFYAPVVDLFASVHTAGGFAMGEIAGDDQPAVFERMMRLNVQTAFLCCRCAALRMRARARNGVGGGRLVNVAARPGLIPREGKGMVPYAVSKAAVAGLTESLAAELAPDHIWVNAVAPSIIDTPANRAAMPDADHASWPTPAQLAETMVFLASPSNLSTTGGLVPVYGSQ